MGEVVTLGLFLGDLLLHRLAIIAMEGIALDERGGDVLTLEDLLEGVLDGGGAGAGRAGDRYDGIFC
ncbi:hypothetical protein D3C72_2436920 [compost metagenome]